MSTQTSAPAAPSPVLIFETMNAYQRSAALRSGIELGVFTAIGAGATTAAEIGRKCEAAERGVRILCDYLTVAGFLTKTNGRYGLTQDSSFFLDSRSPAYIGGAVRFLNGEHSVRSFRQLTESVRRGGTVLEDHSMQADNPIWVDFAEGMYTLMTPAAEATAALLPGGPIRVLDIAAGHGAFGITVARQNPEAEIVAVDWSDVLAVAQRHAVRAGAATRYRTLPGDAFKVDFGSGYDAVLVTNFFHHFSPATNEILLRKIRAALKPGGLAVALEFVPNEDRVSPPVPAAFSLTMLANTQEGDSHTLAEHRTAFQNAGFESLEVHPIQGMPQTIMVGRT